MSTIDPIAFKRIQRRSQATFKRANFAYLRCQRQLFSRLKAMRVNQNAVTVCGVRDAEAEDQLEQLMPDTKLEFILDEADLQQVKSSSCQVIVINLIFSVSDIETIFSLALSKLTVGGVLVFALLGPLTLQELKQAMGKPHHQHVCAFYDMHDIGDSLVRVGFDAPVMENAPWTVRYSNLDRLVEDLRDAGCSNPLQSRPRHLLTANWWSRIMDRYPADDSGKYHVTLDFVYGHAWKVAPKQTIRHDEVQIPIDTIQRR